MIASLACFMALADKQTVGQKWSYILTWHYVGDGIDSTDEEQLNVEVAKVFGQSITLKVSQKLSATILGDERIPTDPKAAPDVKEWALSTNGSVAFMPNARFGLESRFYRILKGIMPEPQGDPSRDKEWTIDYADNGQGIPKSRLGARLVKTAKDGNEYWLNYREKSGSNGTGRFIRTEKTPFPTLLEVHFTNTKMPGGTDPVDCDLAMKLKLEK